MPANPSRPEGADERRPAAQETQEQQQPPVPDGDAPHDVPDEKVIEKTLPDSAGRA